MNGEGTNQSREVKVAPSKETIGSFTAYAKGRLNLEINKLRADFMFRENASAQAMEPIPLVTWIALEGLPKQRRRAASLLGIINTKAFPSLYDHMCSSDVNHNLTLKAIKVLILTLAESYSVATVSGDQLEMLAYDLLDKYREFTALDMLHFERQVLQGQGVSVYQAIGRDGLTRVTLFAWLDSYQKSTTQQAIQRIEEEWSQHRSSYEASVSMSPEISSRLLTNMNSIKIVASRVLDRRSQIREIQKVWIKKQVDSEFLRLSELLGESGTEEDYKIVDQYILQLIHELNARISLQTFIHAAYAVIDQPLKHDGAQVYSDLISVLPRCVSVSKAVLSLNRRHVSLYEKLHPSILLGLLGCKPANGMTWPRLYAHSMNHWGCEPLRKLQQQEIDRIPMHKGELELALIFRYFTSNRDFVKSHNMTEPPVDELIQAFEIDRKRLPLSTMLPDHLKPKTPAENVTVTKEGQPRSQKAASKSSGRKQA
jgi:hypothetical protein